ncbi:MAG: hypothetical protein ACKOX6_05445 [Bdellovibrio sp.]
MGKKALSLYKLFASLIGAILFIWGTSSLAQSRHNTAPPRDATFEDSLIESNARIGKFFDSMANGLDLFLAGQQYTNKTNKTSVILDSSLYYNSKDYLTSDISFNVNLRLPNLEEYWQVTFTSYDETSERGVSQNYLRQQPRTRDYGATLGFFRQLGNVRTSFQPHISFAGAFKISHTLTFESIAEQTKTYRLNPKLQLYADADKGAGIFQAINLHFILRKDRTLTFINEADYQDRPHAYAVTHGLSLGQFFTPTASMSYNTFATFINRPNYQLSSYNFSVLYSQTIYKNILNYQIGPNLTFASKYNYWGNPGGTFHLSLIF